jgi:demethylmenaquinone methyltransferase/2-methoxy-6-polyprenyl-1,4-benzoquinol methylase
MKDKAEYVNKMFSSIAHRYDLLNTLLSLNRDKLWRKFTVSKSGLGRGGTAIDVATGTGELAIELATVVGPEGRVLGVDFNPDMLEKAREKIQGTEYENIIEFSQQRAESLPYPDNTFDCATIGFALRNVTDINKVLQEMTRIVRIGGRVISLEFTQPKNPIFRRLYYLYAFHALPVIGGIISGRKDAYTYLPHSVLDFPSPERLKSMMEDVGLKEVKFYLLTGGIVAVHVGIKS